MLESSTLMSKCHYYIPFNSNYSFILKYGYINLTYSLPRFTTVKADSNVTYYISLYIYINLPNALHAQKKSYFISYIR